MKHITALIIKFVMIAIVLEIILGISTNLTYTQILYVSLTVTAISYILGDLIILPASNNTVATIADAGIALLTIYMFNYFWTYAWISPGTALFAAVILGAGEWFFHKYVEDKVLPNHRRS